MIIKFETWKKIFYIVSTLLAAIGVAFGLSSCSATRATIYQPREGSTTTVTITTNNPVNATVDPAVDVDFSKPKTSN